MPTEPRCNSELYAFPSVLGSPIPPAQLYLDPGTQTKHGGPLCPRVTKSTCAPRPMTGNVCFLKCVDFYCSILAGIQHLEPGPCLTLEDLPQSVAKPLSLQMSPQNLIPSISACLFLGFWPAALLHRSFLVLPWTFTACMSSNSPFPSLQSEWL